MLKGASVITSGALVFEGAVTISNPSVLIQTGGNLTFNSTIDADTSVQTPTNTRTLKLNASNAGDIAVVGAVGSSTHLLATLEVLNSKSTTFTAGVTTGTSVVLTDTLNSIAFNGGLSTTSFTVAAKPFELTLRGDITVDDGIALNNTGVLKLDASLVTAGNHAIALGQAGQTTLLLGDTSFDSGTATTTVNGNMSGTTYTLGFNSPVTFSGASTLTANTVTFEKPVLANGVLTINGATNTNGGAVSSGVYQQIYNGNVTVGGTSDTTFTGRAIEFRQKLDGVNGIYVNDDGITLYNGDIGTVSAPAHFETDADGTSKFSSTYVRTNSAHSIVIRDDAIVTAASTTFDTTDPGNLSTGASITLLENFERSCGYRWFSHHTRGQVQRRQHRFD